MVNKVFKSRNLNDRNVVSGIIMDSLKDGEPVAWADTMALVSERYRVKNWMGVRSVLQGLRDAGMVTRVNEDLCVEEYIKS